jgi:hypothetical protein
VDVAAIDAKLRTAADYLVDPQRREGDAEKGFMLVVDAIALAVPGTTFPGELGKKIQAAKERLSNRSILDEEGTTLLRGAYHLANSGKEFQMPAGISSIEKAVGYARKQIDEARACLQQGKIDESVKLLLTVAVMIVTPMPAP